MYRMTEERLHDPDIGTYDAYGIACQLAEQIIQIRDILLNAAKVSEMAKKFNRFGLAPEHFHDVVEDMIAV